MTRTVESAFDVENAVLSRYKQGAERVQPSLCCPASQYDARYLDVLPEEILNKDYGCGDPSRYVCTGDCVVDLGAGAGKICYILAQKVGVEGQVTGVDFNDQMLALARKHHRRITEAVGYDNVRFAKGRIQDLSLDLDLLSRYLADHPVRTVDDLGLLNAYCDQLRRDHPLIESGSVDVVVSNCVLNLVQPQDRRQLFGEIFRVLRCGGRAVISDIVCDEDPTPGILDDPELWSGCIAGAFREQRLLEMFEEAGFHGMEILDRAQHPWQVIDGIEFRSMTVRAWKGKQGPRLERNQAVIYTGPWKSVIDDDGHRLERGQRAAVCDKTFKLLTDPSSPYAEQLIPVPPLHDVLLDEAAPFECSRAATRSPGETKGVDYHETIRSDEPCCG